MYFEMWMHVCSYVCARTCMCKPVGSEDNFMYHSQKRYLPSLRQGHSLVWSLPIGLNCLTSKAQDPLRLLLQSWGNKCVPVCPGALGNNAVLWHNSGPHGRMASALLTDVFFRTSNSTRSTDSLHVLLAFSFLLTPQVSASAAYCVLGKIWWVDEEKRSGCS